MEVVIILLGILFLVVFIFLLVEYPYYLVSIFIFSHLYNFNLELPGPLDLRGWISFLLVLRLVVFDKENIDLILNKLLFNNIFMLILVFATYNLIITFFESENLIMTLRIMVFNIISVLLGFLVVANGYTKKVLITAVLAAGLFSTADLIYTYFVQGRLRIIRILDFISKSDFVTMNHNFFGMLSGLGLVVTYSLLVSREYNKILSVLLLGVFSLGLLISTSRGVFLAVIVSTLVITYFTPQLVLNFRKIIFSISVFITIAILVGFSYSFILSSMKIESKFADQLYYRLVEEPASIFGSDVKKFDWDDNLKQGTMKWRLEKAKRDLDVFLSKPMEVILFGYGEGGYTRLGEVEFDIREEAYQYSAHNGYINLLAESGILGFFIFMAISVFITIKSLKLLKENQMNYSMIYLFIFMMVYALGNDSKLTGKFTFIILGSIIASISLSSANNIDENEAGKYNQLVNL